MPSGKSLPDTCELVIVCVLQSMNVGGVQVACALQFASPFSVMFDGQLETTGPVWSLTITLKVQSVTLPTRSFPVYVTVVVPMGNNEPEVWLPVRVTEEQLSVAEGGVHIAFA